MTFTYMKNTHFLFILLLLTALMQAQDRAQPKPGNPPVVNIKKQQIFKQPASPKKTRIVAIQPIVTAIANNNQPLVHDVTSTSNVLIG